MSGAPRIFQALNDEDYLLAIQFGLTVMPKSELRNRFKAFKPQGGVRIPKPDRDAPEKVAKFLALQKSGTTLILGMMGLMKLIKEGPWAEVRMRLVSSLKDEDLPDVSDLIKEDSEYQDELRIELVEPVRADLKALEGRELEAEEVKVLLMLEWCFPNMADEVQALIPLKSESEDSGEDDETAIGEVTDPEATQADPETQPVEAPVPSDDFTALDKLLIRAAVDSVGAVEGSLPPEEVADLIEEVIHLNTTRTKSYFHRGYLQALADIEAEPGGQEQNQERRAWEWAGRIIGLARFNRSGEILQEYDQNIDLARLMSEGRFTGAAQGAMPPVVEALLDEGRFQDACALLKPDLVAQKPHKYIPSLILRGRDLVRARKVEEAKRVIGKARELLEVEAVGDGCPKDLQFECERRWGQILRAQGAYRDARTQFERLLEGGGPGAELRTDMALCAAKMRWLDDVMLPVRNTENGALIQQLEKGKADADAALAAGGPASGAAYLLGVEALLHRDGEVVALGFLERAYEMALARDEVYPDSLFFNQLCLALSISILLAMDEGRFNVAHDLLHKALDDGRLSKLPLDLFKRAIDVIRASSHPACLDILQDFEQRCPQILDDHLRNAEFLEASPAVMKLLERRAQSESRSAQSRWNDLEALLSARLKAGDREGSETCLVAMEELALSFERLTHAYIKVLNDPDRSGFVLEDVDRMEARRVLHQVRGQRREEGQVLVELARHALGGRELELAREYLDLAEGLGLNKTDLELEHRWASDLADSLTAPVQVAPQLARQVSILLVGGNEVQARYDDAIRDHFRRVDQRLRIEFIHPAWSSNWNTDVEDVKRKLDTHHALVVMRFNRTLFGRHVRRLAGEHGKLWFPCTGHGRDSLIRAIDRAAGFLRSMPA